MPAACVYSSLKLSISAEAIYCIQQAILSLYQITKHESPYISFILA